MAESAFSLSKDRNRITSGISRQLLVGLSAAQGIKNNFALLLGLPSHPSSEQTSILEKFQNLLLVSGFVSCRFILRTKPGSVA
jgi:hypothetical protein